MNDPAAIYESSNIRIYEWPQPSCEIYDKQLENYVHIKTPEDAKALIISLTDFLYSIPLEFGGFK